MAMRHAGPAGTHRRSAAREGGGRNDMPAEDGDVFVICAASSIAPGAAKAFSLSRLTPEGEGKPFPIFVVRTLADSYVGYVNTCPHQGTWLNIGSGEFFADDRKLLKCGRHGAAFEIETGVCVDGPCKEKSLEPIALAVIDGEVCLCGIPLVEDDGMPDQFIDTEDDDMMEVMIQPD
jgi:nitrite reductase/ring-hydroxylating ferredoxin subunit